MSVFDNIFEGANSFLTGLSDTANNVLEGTVGITEKIGKIAAAGASYQTAPSDNGSGVAGNNSMINIALIFGAFALLLVMNEE